MSEAVANLAGLGDRTVRSSAGRIGFWLSATDGADFGTDVELLGTEFAPQKKMPSPTPIATAQTIAITRMTIRFLSVQYLCGNTLHGRVKMNLSIE
jgi:hypothetical protein